MKEVMMFIPDIPDGTVVHMGNATDLASRPYWAGVAVDTKEEALAIENRYLAQVIQEAYHKRYDEILLSLANVATPETVDRVIDKMLAALVSP